MRTIGADFHDDLARRRSVRMISPEPVPLDVIDQAIATASTAPSGAHMQPWTWVVTGDPDVKRRIREAAEEEERQNYLDHRMNDEWQSALAPLGTDHHKEFLEVAPWIVVLFEQRYGVNDDGSRRHHYYVKESCGIAAGFFIAALHRMGLSTLTHTPSPMAFLTQVLDRPENERPFVLFPVGRALDDVLVPDLRRKTLDEVRVLVGDPPSPSTSPSPPG
ncbi:MAG: nitroreductase family protein [Actinomycetota bacterium]